MPPIPSARRILTDLVLQLKAAGEPCPAPLSACPGAREIVVALEYLLPGGVMPALDVLDRGLVTRYCLKRGDEGEVQVDVEGGGGVQREIPGTPDGSESEISDVGGELGEEKTDTETKTEPKPKPKPQPKRDQQYSYYVRSDHPPPVSSSNRSKKPLRRTPPTYSVRPTAWFCTCDAFVFAAFAVPPPPVLGSELEALELARMMEACGWVWGGCMRGVRAPPVCKHLVACVLAENCGEMFMPFVKRVELGVEEMVGVGAGVWRV